MEEARWSCLHGAVEEAQKMIQDALAQIDDPVHISCTSSAGKKLNNAALSCTHSFDEILIQQFLQSTSQRLISADYLASRCQASLDAVEQLRLSREAFLAGNSGEVSSSRRDDL